METMASLVIGPAMSLLAILTPLAEPVSKAKEPEAGAARPRVVWAERLRAARWAGRLKAEQDSIVIVPAGSNWRRGEELVDTRMSFLIDVDARGSFLPVGISRF